MQVALAKDPPPGELEKGVLAVIDEHASLNITAVLKQSLQRLRTEIVEKVLVLGWGADHTPLTLNLIRRWLSSSRRRP